MTTAERIRSEIERIPKGQLFTSASFTESGSRAAVDQALARLAKAQAIQRVTRGVFVRPQENRFLGTVPPTPFQVAQAVSQRTGAVVQVHGAEAARALGLSTQAPIQPVYLTTGPSRRITLGAQVLTLKHTSPRKLLLAGRPAGLALTALWYLGKHEVSPETIAALQRRLPPEEFAALKGLLASMPGWMVDAFQEHERQTVHA